MRQRLVKMDFELGRQQPRPHPGRVDQALQRQVRAEEVNPQQETPVCGGAALGRRPRNRRNDPVRPEFVERLRQARPERGLPDFCQGLSL